MKTARYQIDGREAGLVNKILRRVRREMIDVDGYAVMMSLVACHSNGCPLSFDYMLTLAPNDLAREVNGIVRHTDRRSGKIEGFKPWSMQSRVGDNFDQRFVESPV